MLATIWSSRNSMEGVKKDLPELTGVSERSEDKDVPIQIEEKLSEKAPKVSQAKETRI